MALDTPTPANKLARTIAKGWGLQEKTVQKVLNGIKGNNWSLVKTPGSWRSADDKSGGFTYLRAGVEHAEKLRRSWYDRWLAHDLSAVQPGDHVEGFKPADADAASFSLGLKHAFQTVERHRDSGFPEYPSNKQMEKLRDAILANKYAPKGASHSLFGVSDIERWGACPAAKEKSIDPGMDALNAYAKTNRWLDNSKREDRVRFRISMFRIHVPPAFGQPGKTDSLLLRLIQECFGLDYTTILSVPKVEENGTPYLEILCRPDQFGRFIVRRNQCGAPNLVKELDAKLEPAIQGATSFVDVSQN